MIKLKIRPMEATFGNKKIKLSPVEFFLLQLFLENEGEVMRVKYLYEEVWGADMEGDRDAMKKAVSGLKKKKGIVMKIITTVTGCMISPTAKRHAPKTNKFTALTCALTLSIFFACAFALSEGANIDHGDSSTKTASEKPSSPSGSVISI